MPFGYYFLHETLKPKINKSQNDSAFEHVYTLFFHIVMPYFTHHYNSRPEEVIGAELGAALAIESSAG